MSRKMLVGAAIAGSAAALTREYWRRSRQESLAGEVVLITGGSRGLGLAMAREFARHGCKVAMCARDRFELDSARADLERQGAEVFSYVCDVTRRDEVEAMIQVVSNHFGRIDILVNNAGVIDVGPVEDMRIEDFEKAMDVMFWGTVYSTMAMIPAFLGRRRGRIVNISSIGGRVSVPHLVPYTSAKFAVAGFSDGLAVELRPKGVRVTTIYPGLMRTGSFIQALFKGDQEKEARWFTLGATLPLVSMDAANAARQIVTAVKRGESERILSAPARTLATMSKLFPGGTSELLSVAATTLLPAATGNRTAKSGALMWEKMHPALKLAGTFGIRAIRNYNQARQGISGARS